jgi:beta-galactosidase
MPDTSTIAQPSSMKAPEFAHRLVIGAEIMDDPAATPEKVDHWFKLLADYQLPLARVFIPSSEENLRRMDWFFRAAEKHQVGITATLGGPPSPENEQWIHDVVLRYKDSPALDSWILMNEPGQVPESNPLTINRFKGWLKEKYSSIDILNHTWGKNYLSYEEIEFSPGWLSGFWSVPAVFLDWYTFWRSHLTWHLKWIAEQIRKVDLSHPIHVNPHALVGNLAGMSFDLPAWRDFLTSLGSSVHPSWHFTLLGRDQYALGVAYICDLIQGAIEPKPFWITELQGGNNTNSGNRPLYPHPEDIAQWLWIGFGSGAERIIFWLLNNRSFGVESGEWSLLDLQDQPSERLDTAGQIARILNQNAAFFQDAQPVETPITIILSLETMTLQERFEKSQPVTSTERGIPVRLEGRGRNAHILAALAYYEIFHQMGIPVHIKHIHDFDWQTDSSTPQLVILPNVVALSGEQARDIQSFVQNGNTVFITGLTGAWDAENRFWPLASQYPLQDLLGATLKEIRTLDKDCQVELLQPAIKLPSNLWVGEIRNFNAEPIGRQNGWITAVRKQAGKGEAIWIPSLVDLGAWFGDNQPFARFLSEVSAPFTDQLPFRFVGQQAGCMLRVLRNGGTFLTVIANGTSKTKHIRLQYPQGLCPQMLWGKGTPISPTGEITLAPRETLVAFWK